MSHRMYNERRRAEVVNSEVWQTLDSLVRFQPPPNPLKSPVGAGTPTRVLTRTAEPHEDRNSIIRPVGADFNKGVRHERTRSESSGNRGHK